MPVLVALGLTMTPALASAPEEKLWAGYVIAKGKRADSGFVGARKVGKAIVYRIDPRARPTADGYRRAVRLGDSRAAARAAWILAKYGDVRIADQAAAVDVATYALLAGQGVASKRTKHRLRSTGRSAVVRGLARQLLRKSARFAGPYEVSVRTTPAIVGGRLRVTASVRSAAGVGVPGLAVTLVSTGEAQRVRTDRSGVARLGFEATEVGYRRARITVAGLATSRVKLRKPHNRKASRVAIAGRRRSRQVPARLMTQAVPTVTLTDPKTDAEIGKAFSVAFTMSGTAGSPERAVDVAVFGPFAAGTEPDCSGSPAATGAGQVAGDGSYRTPAIAVSKPGLYFWSVHAEASDLNTAASGCGAASRVTRRPTLALDAGPGGRLRFRVQALTTGYDAKATAVLYGPYAKKANIGCGSARKLATRKVRVTANGRYRTEKVTAKKQGWYAWRLTLPADAFTKGVTTSCRAAGSVVRLG
ncbi:MAG: hypothetical protein QM655_03235 [Nocardioidaceae bacterium]